ncbi:hypothetical protein NA57DRAFT_56654 [Rhizodiscina lignyota]|uniref:Aminoglycoside phosphotransferase domain-containing protein n=1 Tax=Rhizodiscina lignyota TaxID=1504668 RepID=A0A9P4M5U2_9PEZI|nr:hypothetical protein NA57DRAFT_56654 [Rhizodiscina lignyota]
MAIKLFKDPAGFITTKVNEIKKHVSGKLIKEEPGEEPTPNHLPSKCKVLRRCVSKAKHAMKCTNRAIFHRQVSDDDDQASNEAPFVLRITPPKEIPPLSDPPAYQSDDSEDPETRIWGPVLHIPDERYIALALKHGPICVPCEDGWFKATEARVIGHTRGASNRITFIEYNDPDNTRIVVRVPSCGWRRVWMPIDGEAIVNQVKVMKYLKRKTGIPIPEVISYDTTIDDNVLGAPYIMMECMEGEAVCVAWWDEEEPIPLEQKRQNIMKSLAETMVKLRDLKFDKIGSLYFEDFDDGTIGEPWIGGQISVMPGMLERDDEYLQTRKEDLIFPEYGTSQEFMREVLDIYRSRELKYWGDPFYDGRRNIIHGLHKLYSIIIDYMPFSELTAELGAEPEHFVIAPPDFDQQNIIVDKLGNITGLIDWDVVKTVPRFKGWAALPRWLQQDWYDRYQWPDWEQRRGPTMSPSELCCYRQQYTKYMREACTAVSGGQDGEEIDEWRFTSRSHLYDRVFETVGEDGMDGFLEKLLELFVPRAWKATFISNLGQYGFAPGQEELLRNKINEILAY